MHYTADFCMRHYAGFSQIGSHLCKDKYPIFKQEAAKKAEVC